MRILVLLALAVSASGFEIIDGARDPRRAGDGCVNRFSVASQKDAQAKVARLRAGKTPVSVAQFLGGPIKLVRVVYADPKAGGFAKARSLVRDVLAAPLLAPGVSSEPRLFPDWAEEDGATARALVIFEDGTVGRAETDGTHLFLEDSAGTFWWYRFPSRKP